MARELSDLETAAQQADTHFKNGQWLDAYNLYKTLIGESDTALLRSSESLFNAVKAALFSADAMENNIDAMGAFQNLDSENNRGIRSKALAISNEICSKPGAPQTQNLLDRALLQHLNFMFLSAGIMSGHNIVAAVFRRNKKVDYSEKILKCLREILRKDNENIGANIELALRLHSRAMQDNRSEGESNEDDLEEACEKCKIAVDAFQSTTLQRAAAFRLLRNIRERQSALGFKFSVVNPGLEKALDNPSVDTKDEYKNAHKAIENVRFGYFKETLDQLRNILKADSQNIVANIQLAILLFERATQDDEEGDEKNTQDTKSAFLKEAGEKCLVVLNAKGRTSLQTATALHLLGDVQQQLEALNLPSLASNKERVVPDGPWGGAVRMYEGALMHPEFTEEQRGAAACALSNLYRKLYEPEIANGKVQKMEQTPTFRYLQPSPLTFSKLITAGVITPPICPLHFKPTVLNADENKDDNSASAVVVGSHVRQQSTTTSVEAAANRSARGQVKLKSVDLHAVLKGRRATVSDVPPMPVSAVNAAEEKGADYDPAPSIAKAHLSLMQEFSQEKKDGLWERFSCEVLKPCKEAMRMNGYKSPKLNFAYAYALLDYLIWYGIVGEHAQETRENISGELVRLETNFNRLKPGEENLKALLKDIFEDINGRLKAVGQGLIPAPQHPQKAAERVEALAYVANQANMPAIAPNRANPGAVVDGFFPNQNKHVKQPMARGRGVSMTNE